MNPMRVLPAEPLLRLLDLRYPDQDPETPCLERAPGATDEAHARRLWDQVITARQRGIVTWITADELAVRLLGLNPLNVWGAAWEEVSNYADRIAVAKTERNRIRRLAKRVAPARRRREEPAQASARMRRHRAAHRDEINARRREKRALSRTVSA